MLLLDILVEIKKEPGALLASGSFFIKLIFDHLLGLPVVFLSMEVFLK
jgi:hypothetical protein